MFVESPVIDVILKVTVVLALAPIAARALSRGSAAARHQIWVVALAASLLMPVLAAVAPQWQIEVLPAPTTTPQAVSASNTGPRHIGCRSGVRTDSCADTECRV
jgi:hypothetical protein